MVNQVPLRTVTLVASESVEQRGTRRISWLVRAEREWRVVARLDHARVKNLPLRAGVIWEQEIEIELAVGTELKRVTTTPLPAPRQHPMAHLRRDRRGAPARKVEHHYRVTEGGGLERWHPEK